LREFAEQINQKVRRFYRAQRRKQLDTMAALRARIGVCPRRREGGAIHLYTTEPTFDAIAQGEIQALGLPREWPHFLNDGSIQRFPVLVSR
jgi:hypothetical protein